MSKRLLIVGNPASFHVGHHLLQAAGHLGLDCQILDMSHAYGEGVWQKLMWRWDHTPANIKQFEAQTLTLARSYRPEVVITTGLSPLRESALASLSDLGCQLINFSTDDPWNPNHRANWFLKALPAYHHVFTPRRANMSQFELVARSQSCVDFLRFGYNPEQHYVEPSAVVDSSCDVLIVGGADKERIPYAAALVNAGLKVAAYGGYWQRAGIDALQVAGHASVEVLRRASREAKLNLVLVRRANRDGHVMRTFEAWACGGLLLVEDTTDHRELFGQEDKCVAYFTSPQQAVQQAQRLLREPALRHAMRIESLRHLQAGLHAYTNRLDTILKRCDIHLNAVPASVRSQ